MHKGQLKSWKDDKGFGFIQCKELKQDTFIHISTLKAMSRKPKVGDFIYFELEIQDNGKSRAINCRIEGVAVKEIPVHKPRYQKRHKPCVNRNNTTFKSKLVLIIVVIGICAFAFQRLGLKTHSSSVPHSNDTPAPKGSLLNRAFTDTNSQFSCDGRQYCSEMKSRAEAVYFINHCPNTKMDGDSDGIPCEKDTRF